METVALFLLGGTYHAVGPDVVVELFGKTREGTPVVARYYGFRPYFELTEPTQDSLTRLKADPEITQVEPTTLWLEGADRPAVRVTLHSPWKVP